MSEMVEAYLGAVAEPGSPAAAPLRFCVRFGEFSRMQILTSTGGIGRRSIDAVESSFDTNVVLDVLLDRQPYVEA